ncbi:MAG: hypothetical protein AB7H66_12095 [Hyphomonadaceae bacterium]
MGAYVLEVRRASLGSGPGEIETVCALGNTQTDVLTLVRTALQLTDETVSVVRELTDAEAKEFGLKPFQVRHIR